MQPIEVDSELYNIPKISVSYKTKPGKRYSISRSEDIFKLLKAIWNRGTIELIEEMKVIYLNRSHNVIGVLDLATGGECGVLINKKLLFATAVLCNASYIILAHNHPSGTLKPSESDIKITNEVKQVATLLHISLSDHIIITHENYFSFADDGII